MADLTIKHIIENKLKDNLIKHSCGFGYICNTTILFDEAVDTEIVEEVVKTMEIKNTDIELKKNKYGTTVYLTTFLN